MWGYTLPTYIAESIMRATKFEELKSIVLQYTSDIGFGRVTFHLARGNRHTAEIIALISDYPGEWVKRYIDNRYAHLDLVHRKALSTVKPFVWSDLTRGGITTECAKVFNEASDFGIKDGISVPVRGLNTISVFSALALGTEEEKAHSLAQGSCALMMLASHLHEKACQLSKIEMHDGFPQLTSREQEVLQWVANGKTSVEVSDILAISSGTVGLYIKACLAKMGVQTKAHATAKAAMMGIVEMQ